ncbi:MAG: SDR family oxidoreductase [Armatimonadetes bacterium]|nr:SDR family oxidoreductase [Armatimonadota bacterium]
MLEDQVVLVTGAGRGIGRAIALAFADAGSHVAALARSVEEIEETATLVRAKGRKAAAIRCDVASPEEITRAHREAVEALGPIDILVNNAGFLAITPILETSLEDFEQTLAVNLRATFLFCQAVLPSMIERGGGTILNIASTSSKRWYVGQGAYCAAKHGVLGLTKVLAEEMRPHNIRVSAICPGGVNTRMVQEERDDILPEEWMDPEDIGRLAVFLATLPPKAAIDEVVIRRFASSPLHG